MDGSGNYRKGRIVYLMLNPILDMNLQLIWLRAKSSADVIENYELADKLELKQEVATWLDTTGMKPKRTYYGSPLCIELMFKDEVDAQLFCLAFKIT
jgi:hypothetical protein